MKPRQHRASALPNPPTFPALYIVEVRGDGMAPLIEDGARLAVSRDERPKAGDVIVIWHRTKEGAPECFIRRMTFDLPYFVKAWPHREHPESEAHAALMFEQLNPPQHFGVECCKLLAVHKALGDQAKEEGGRGLSPLRARA